MDIEKVKELALANGFKLKEQASGNLDLNAYVYDFANAIEQDVKAQEYAKLKLLLCDEHLEKCESPTGIFNSQYPEEEPCLICLAKEAKAQAVPDLIELQERIAGHQYYHDEHSHMIVDMDDVVKEISGFDGWKTQAVPEGFAFKDVINERQRQINQESYSTENDDEYKQNELLRAAVCYAENVVRRGWVFDSNFDPDVYQEEEVPDLWPWDIDFWKPKNPRKDLVRAAALLIAEIERMDRSTGASQ
ncbi:hypothetical protein [Acinetobacter variabilis]|uniref:hypothetical protein n=1 Tax=Acinetobacter variabilis TaxID=70346 RepID=UPI0028B1E964|nr:hypothetical protein [Acinetobacter variabilis]